MTMTHPGLPFFWVMTAISLMLLLSVWCLMSKAPQEKSARLYPLARMPFVGAFFRFLNNNTWPLLLLKIFFASLFILMVSAGLWGSPIVERNLATALTWNLWWTGVIIAVLFSGSAWCAICPWDNIASWLVNRRLWGRATNHSRLNLKLPRFLRSIWPATLLFIGFTWLELGVGIVSNPYATALLALLMVVLATTALALFEGKSFCRYMCPVGRTIGAYSQLAPIALRPIDNDICRDCTTLECYHGSDDIAACPTKLVMGRLQENTYCTSCGNCTQSCPSNNVGWSLRSPSHEAIQVARPHTDEAFFMLVLFALTLFHGLTMLDSWQQFISSLAQSINDKGQLLVSFSVGLVICLATPILFFCGCITATRAILGKNNTASFTQYFSGLAFVCLPLAFSYHLTHNLNHFFREPTKWGDLIANPLGINAEPLSMMEKHMRHSELMVPEQVMFFLQSVIMVAGFLIAILVIRHRGKHLFGASGLKLLPMLAFAFSVTLFSLWMLVQPMTMRM